MLRAPRAKRYRAQLTFAFERDWLKTDVAQNTIQMSAIALSFQLKWKPCGNMSVPNSLFGKKQENNRKVFIYIIIPDIDLPKNSII